MNDLIVKEDEELKGLEKSKAAQIKAVFQPMVEMLEGFEKKYREVMSLEISPDKCKQAKRLRLDISKVRISADKIRWAQKEEYIRAGNAIQGVYNILKFAVTDKEEKLKEIETYYENLEAEKIKKLQLDREIELSKYEADGKFVDLGNMPEEVWENYLAGVKNNYESVKEAERKAEEARIIAEKKIELANKRRLQCSRLADFIPDFEKIGFADLSDEEYKILVDSAIKEKTAYEEEQEKIRKENERLRIEAEEAEKIRLAEQKKAEAEKKKAEEKLRIEREKAEAEKRIQDEIIRKEREARERIEKEIREKEQIEKLKKEREIAEKAEAEKKMKLAPDKDKLFIIINYIDEQMRTLHADIAITALTKAKAIIEATIKTM